MKYIKATIFVFGIFYLASCAAYQPSKDTDDQKLPNSITLEAGKNGLLPSKGFSPSKSIRHIVISDVGDQERIKIGERVELQLDYWDIESTCLVTTTNPETNEVILELKDRDHVWVTLKEKCDIVELRGIETIPQIEIESGLNPEQIIITPLFDDFCNKIGYQFRYGSTERGCYDAAKDVLKRFRDCAGGKKSSKKRKVPDCLEEVWFGVPCP
jgi:hypothetical protein